jgi:hypothetical protein
MGRLSPSKPRSLIKTLLLFQRTVAVVGAAVSQDEEQSPVSQSHIGQFKSISSESYR